MAMSLDGFTADRNSATLYPIEELRGHESLDDLIRGVGAVAMGRRTYDMARGDFTGYEYQAPAFVLTHRPPREPAKGLSFSFVTDGPQALIREARAAAGDKNVMVVGGANVAQQLLREGLLDRIRIRLMPVLLGDGLRLFDHLDPRPIQLARSHVAEVSRFQNLQFDLKP